MTIATLPKDLQIAQKCLAAMKLERADNYPSWVQVGQVLKTIANPDPDNPNEELDHLAFEMWDSWSRSSYKYQAGECENRWQRFTPGRVKLGSLIYWAREDGATISRNVKIDPANFTLELYPRVDFPKWKELAILPEEIRPGDRVQLKGKNRLEATVLSVRSRDLKTQGNGKISLKNEVHVELRFENTDNVYPLSSIHKVLTTELEIEYPYSYSHKVVRRQTPDRLPRWEGGKKTKEIRPWHRDDSGEWKIGKGPGVWPLYREHEAREAIAAGNPCLLYAAGEQAVEKARSLGLIAFSNQGGEGQQTKQILEFVKDVSPDVFYIWPDNDSTGYKSAQDLAKSCAKAGIPTIVIDPQKIWEDIPKKGDITDVIEKSGMDKETIIERLEAEIRRGLLKRNETESSDEKKEEPRASVIASELTEKYRAFLAYNAEDQSWYRYASEQQGIWSREHEKAVRNIVISELEVRPDLPKGFNGGLVSSVMSLMEPKLLVKHWNEASGLLPFQNGVLERKTNKFLPHSPGYKLTWLLPYSYDPLATCEPIQEWLREAQDGDEQLVQLLRAYLKAILDSRTDLQRFVECLGPAGTGKSTYTRLAIALVGWRNVFMTSLKDLETNRFESAGIFGKKLVLISDSERYGGNVSVLKSLTGQDPLRFEQKNIQQSGGFVPKAMVLVAANESLQSSDYTSGLQRRRLTIPFMNQVAPDRRRDLLTVTDAGVTGEFAAYLPGLINWVLAMPDDEVTRLVRCTEVAVPSLAVWERETLLESNPIAEWLDHCCVIDADAKTYVGVAKSDKSQESQNRFLHINQWLYASYCEYSAAVGNRSVSGRRFTTLLRDLCCSQLRRDVKKGRDAQGSYFEGIAIRNDIKHYGCPRPITGSCDRDSDDGAVTASEAFDDGLVTAETTGSDAFDGSDGSFENDCEVLNQSLEIPPDLKASAPLPEVVKDIAQKASQASDPSLPVLPDITPTITEPLPNPSLDCQPITPGDRVEYLGSKYEQLYGSIPLQVAFVADGQATCSKPDGRLTARLDVRELKRIQITERSL